MYHAPLPVPKSLEAERQLRKALEDSSFQARWETDQQEHGCGTNKRTSAERDAVFTQIHLLQVATRQDSMSSNLNVDQHFFASVKM